MAPSVCFGVQQRHPPGNGFGWPAKLWSTFATNPHMMKTTKKNTEPDTVETPSAARDQNLAGEGRPLTRKSPGHEEADSNL
ncbi:hypothetical protein PoB_001485700 [Plakobranchus ocellatus]|uniref:Uncharacterized protein n=1 Tax=Plakobranchus ocellatus TaxID=259542 RepID=A0AAV3YZG6_9GAST|nr:hypothetical protein PoB_001485700 [Plakobranchus ocellatus]